jgi:hypothetical protein
VSKSALQTANNHPNGRRIGATLAGTIDEIRGTMLVSFIGDAKLGLEEILDFREGVGMDKADLAVHAVLATNNAGNVGNNPIKTTRGIEVGLDLGFAAGSGNLVL